MFQKIIYCLFLLISFFILPPGASAQNTVITGKVTDQEGHPVENVSVLLKGTTNGTTTAADGTYRLSVTKSSGNILVFSSIGFSDQEIPQQNGTVVNAQLEKSSNSLNAVVVVGYGTQRKKDITGSVVSIDKQRLENMPNSNFAQALEGSVPGVSVNTTGGGAEGNSVNILIRGQKSIKANTDPLIILDGIPYNGGLSDINPQDIASIDILKDASAAAIYGSRGSNGVILLTTKRGSNGKPVISYDGFTGWQTYSNLPPVLQGDAFYNFKVTREPGSITASEQAIYNSKNYPDWLDLTTRTGTRTQHSLGFRGGSNNFKYYASVTYLDVKGIAVNDNFKRLSTRINLEANLTKWLTYGTNTQLSYDDRSGLSPTFSGDYGAYNFNPLTSPYDSLGHLTIYPWPEDVFFANPLAPTLAKSLDNTYKVFSTNYFQVKLPFVPGLSYRLNTGTEYQSREIDSYYGRDTRTGIQAGGSLSTNNSLVRNYTVENVLNYDKTFHKHTIGFTGLYSYEYDNTRSSNLAAQGFPNDVLTFYQANVALAVQPTSAYAKQTLISQMARINYNYDSRFLLTLTGRRDGFSGFGENKKYGFFPSAALGWNITNEKFLNNSKVLTNLKLRLSYGSNGNQAVGAYQTLAKLSTRSYVDGVTTAPGYVPTSLANPDLHWETSNTANVGFDFTLWNGRLSGTMDYYDIRTHDLLLDRQISSVQGITKITENIGKTANRGFELGLTSVNMQTKNFSWTSNANITINRNRIVDLYGDGKNDTLNKWFIGKPINVQFDYKFGGVWQLTDDTLHTPQGVQHPGYAKVVDVNGDGVVNSYDRTIISNLQPDFSWGLGNTFKYKNLSLYIFMYGVVGTTSSNSLMTDNNVNAGVRHTTVVKNWWTPTNPTNDFYANTLNANTLGAAIVQNSSFLRIRDVMLSYDFSAKMLDHIGLSKLRVYIETRNPFTFTKWTGLDPEFTSQTAIPLQKEFLVGISVNL